MDIDFGTILNLLEYAFANKIAFGGAIGLVLGWNLPQPAFAKKIQGWIGSGLSYTWRKIFNKDEEKK